MSRNANGIQGSSQLDILQGVTRVIAEPLRLKHKLAIGEDAYASTRVAKVAGDAMAAVSGAGTGGAAAASSVVASTFLGGWLSAAGVATAVTPVGWVIGAAVVTGGICLGVTRLLREYERSRVHSIPAFINTPVDVLGLGLFDLMAGLALKLCEEGDGIGSEEREIIADVFVSEWGFDPKFVQRALPLIEQAVAGRTLEDMAQALAQFHHVNPDCNALEMHIDLILFLSEVAEADGRVDAGKTEAIRRVDAIFRAANPSLVSVATDWLSALSALSGRATRALPEISLPVLSNRFWDWVRPGETAQMVDSVQVPEAALTAGGPAELVEAFAAILPETAMILMGEDACDAEAQASTTNRKMVMWFTPAPATDAV